MEKMIYTVPDYYPSFSCKMGACRHACCNGWPVSISLNDYYRLLGEKCSPFLRRRIDGSLHLQEHPTNEEYAVISPNFLGECPMRMEDGRCALHAELGETALSEVCRLYPRGVRTEGDNECSCANSCEAVIELFLRHPEPLQFIRMPLSVSAPAPHERSVYFETVGREQDIRLYFIRILQRRETSLPARFVALGHAMHTMQNALREKDAESVDAQLRSAIPDAAGQVYTPSDDDLQSALVFAEGLLGYIDEHSRSIHDFGQASLEYFTGGRNALEQYCHALTVLSAVLPDWSIVFEHLLVNHMFFGRFPFQDRPESIYDEFAALCMIYIILRFLCLGWVALHPDIGSLVDVCAAAFRFFDHTAFDRFASSILKRLGCATSEDVLRLLML